MDNVIVPFIAISAYLLDILKSELNTFQVESTNRRELPILIGASVERRISADWTHDLI